VNRVIVVDLGYGDGGKAPWWTSCAPARSTDRSALVRFSGGAQAEHNVVARDGRCHAFAQFGAGTFMPEVRSGYLGAYG
jgi:adenylosuccinate synthase